LNIAVKNVATLVRFWKRLEAKKLTPAKNAVPKTQRKCSRLFPQNPVIHHRAVQAVQREHARFHNIWMLKIRE
jgi:hypothetical protein